MKLFIIRHAESTNNRLDSQAALDIYLTKRTPDPALTELGERQAQALAEHLANAQVAEHYTKYFKGNGYGITRIYCSPMLRAMQTAQPMQKVLGINPEVNLHLYERGGLFLGDPSHLDSCVGCPGMSRSEMIGRFPAYTLPQEITEEGWYTGSYEPISNCIDRVETTTRWLSELAVTGSDERVALVGHADFIDKLVKVIIGHGADGPFCYNHHNTGITCIDFGADGRRKLDYVNRTEHLTQEQFD